MFLVREVKTEKYICEINGNTAIGVELDDDEYAPTQFDTIEEAQECINTLCKDIQWQIVVSA